MLFNCKKNNVSCEIYLFLIVMTVNFVNNFFLLFLKYLWKHNSLGYQSLIDQTMCFWLHFEPKYYTVWEYNHFIFNIKVDKSQWDTTWPKRIQHGGQNPFFKSCILIYLPTFFFLFEWVTPTLLQSNLLVKLKPLYIVQLLFTWLTLYDLKNCQDSLQWQNSSC